MNRLKPYQAELAVLAKANPKLRKAILTAGDDKLIQLLRECIVNVMRGNVQVSKSNKEKLKKYKQALRKIIHSKRNKQTRKTLIQKGGILPFLIPAIVAALGGVAASGVGAAVSGAMSR